MPNMKEGGHSEWLHLSSQVTVTCDRAWLSWGWLNTCWPMGSEWISCLALLVWTAFALPIKLSLTQPTLFSLSLFWFSPPPNSGECVCVCVPSCLLPYKSKASAQNWTSIMHMSSSFSAVKTFWFLFTNAQRHSLDCCLHLPAFLHNRGKKHLHIKAKEHYVEFNILFK